MKRKAQWTPEKKRTSNCNNKVINVIYNGVSPSEFRIIFACPNAKEAWDLLRTIHEGTYTVKKTKLQNPTIAFETLRMKEYEMFDEFNAKLSHIVNTSFNLGEQISEAKTINKILRSLPESFCPKVVAIEEYQNLDSLSVEELVGNL